MLLLNKEGIESITRDGLTKDEKLAGGAFPGTDLSGADAARRSIRRTRSRSFPISASRSRCSLRNRKNGEEMTALLRLPVALDALHPACRDRKRHVRFIPLEEAVSLFIAKLFPGYEVKGSGTFRIIRDSDIEVEEEAEDLVRLFETRAEAPPPRLGDPHRVRQR